MRLKKDAGLFRRDQFAIEQLQKDGLHDLAICGQFGCDAHLLHQGVGHALAGFGPDFEKQVEALLDGRILTGKPKPENRFWVIAREELEAGRRDGIVLGEQRLGKSRSQSIQAVPLLDKAGAEHQFLERGQVLGSHARGEQTHLRGRHIGMDTLHEQFGGQIAQCGQSLLVGLFRGPGREE